MPPERGFSCAGAPGAATATSNSGATAIERSLIEGRMGSPVLGVVGALGVVGSGVVVVSWVASSEAAAEVWVGEVADRVTEEVQREDRQADRQPREEEHPGRGL